MKKLWAWEKDFDTQDKKRKVLWLAAVICTVVEKEEPELGNWYRSREE